ncbi:MAG: aldo/keto reductase [Acidobacteriota bacterium]
MARKPGSRREFLKLAALSGVSAGMLAGVARGDEPAGGEKATPATRVPRRILGATGESIPILLLGCAQRFNPKYDKILHRAFAAGVDYLDTALAYEDGWSHRTIAPFIKQIGDRSKLWITSKGPGRGGTVAAYTRELDECLAQLETDYLDLYFMHALDDLRFLDPPFLKMGEKMKASGKTRYFGFSCHGKNVVGLLEKAAKSGGIDVIMFAYNFGEYGNLELNRAIDACVKAGIGLIAMKTQKSVPADQEQVVRFRSRNFTLPQAKLKAVWADERITAAVSHINNTRKLRENVAAARSPVALSMDEFQQLQRLATVTAPVSCRGCAEICESRVDAPVAIADTLRFLMYHDAYGEPDKARRLYRALPEPARRADGVDFSRAAAACPRGIDIAARMRRAQQVLATT